MALITPLEVHLTEIMGWFNCEDQLKQWAGPNFRYPFDQSSFMEDLNVQENNSFSLVSDSNEFLAFGQYYRRLNRCHLGRLIVHPLHRGKGIVSQLIIGISEQGQKALQVESSSLFVLSHNKSAITAYQKSGFIVTDYPEQIILADCLYMVKID
jgi:ribosomal protein S18 acetylase RimI-like enzyme